MNCFGFAATNALGIPVLLGPEIKVPEYTPEQAELWIDRECPMYTGIMAAVNGIAFKRHGCFIDRLNEAEKRACFDDAGKTGLAWFEMPNAGLERLAKGDK